MASYSIRRNKFSGGKKKEETVAIEVVVVRKHFVKSLELQSIGSSEESDSEFTGDGCWWLTVTSLRSATNRYRNRLQNLSLYVNMRVLRS